MYRFCYCLSFFFVCITSASASLFSQGNARPLFAHSFNLQKLTSENYDLVRDLDFTHELNRSQVPEAEGNSLPQEQEDLHVWIVDYYAPWCPHCRHFAPVMERLARTYVKINQAKRNGNLPATDKPLTKVSVGVVDCTQHGEVCNRERIHAYPGIKLFIASRDHEIQEDLSLSNFHLRNYQGILRWIETQVQKHGYTTGAIDLDLSKLEDEQEETEQAKRERLRSKEAIIKDLQHDEHTELELTPEQQDVLTRFDRMRDAGTAILYSLENGYFMGTTELKEDRYAAAIKWLTVLSETFPLQQNRRVLHQLLESVQQRSEWTQESWSSMIEKWKHFSYGSTYPEDLFTREITWESCEGYTCGLWTFLHFVSVGTEHASNVEPADVVDGVRSFIKYFFGCEECVMHFLKANPPSIIDKAVDAGEKGSEFVINWLWLMHNIVNKVLKYPIWPSIEDCPVCYVDGISKADYHKPYIHEEGITSYMKHAYSFAEEDIVSKQYALDEIEAITFGLHFMVCNTTTSYLPVTKEREHHA